MARNGQSKDGENPASFLDLGSVTREEYGGGTELPVTGYLIAGFLSFWIYSVWNYHRDIAQHLSSRLGHSGSTIGFLHWVCRTLRDHEYNELLMAKHVADGKPIREISPSRVGVE